MNYCSNSGSLTDTGADPDKIFSTFFGSDRGQEFSMFFDDDFGFGGPGGMFGRMSGLGGGFSSGPGANRFGGHPQTAGPKQYQIELNLTLEELYT